MFDHMIVPFDGSARAQEAARVASDLCRRFGGVRLHLVTGTDTGTQSSVTELKAKAMARSDEAVDLWVEPGRTPAKAIASVVEHRPRSIVCMATSARTGVRKVVYGSMADDVLGLVDVPVILVGPACNPPDPFELRHVVVCVDDDGSAPTTVATAAELARHYQLPVVLLHVVTPDHEGPAFDLRPLAAELEGATRLVEPITVEAPSATEGILDVLARSGGALVLMAANDRSRHIGRSRLGHGSTVSAVVRASPVPILVVPHDPLDAGLVDRPETADSVADEPVRPR